MQNEYRMEGVNLIINIAGNHEYPGIWDSVYYFKPSGYPNITDWELRKLILFFDYEKRHGRETTLDCKNDDVIQTVNHALANPKLFLSTKKPNIITECTACKHKGCLTDYLCHGTEIDNAKSIFKCGKLLSAVKARNKPAQELIEEPRAASKDPLDYFNYIMMSWGNCIACDSLVMERMLGRFPNEYDLSVDFKPGVRFYFKYETIENHKNYANDGMHPAKVKNELVLADYLHCCIIPENHKLEFVRIIPSVLIDRVFYIKNDCKDIWDWTEKVYDFVCNKTRHE